MFLRKSLDFDEQILISVNSARGYGEDTGIWGEMWGTRGSGDMGRGEFSYVNS